MAKLRKRKKKNGLNRFAAILFTLSLFSLLVSSLLVGTYNNALTIEIQNMNSEIESLKADNQTLNIEISSLENKDRVYEVAQDAGLDQNQDNVISIQGAE